MPAIPLTAPFGFAASVTWPLASQYRKMTRRDASRLAHDVGLGEVVAFAVGDRNPQHLPVASRAT